MAFDLAKIDTSKAEALIYAGVTALSGIGLIKFEVDRKIPMDETVAPFAKILGYGLVGIAAYQLWRSYMQWK